MEILVLLLTLVVWGLIFYILWWGLGAVALPEPFAKIATVILVVAAVYVAISILVPYWTS